MAAGDIFKVAFEHTLGLGQDAVFTMHYRQLISGIGINEAEALANDIWNTVDGDYQQIMVGSTILNRISVTQVTGSPLQFFNLTLAEAGTMAGQQLPPQDAPLVSWYTDTIGRNQHGRIYLTPIAEAFQEAGQIDPTIQSFIQGVADALITVNELLIPVWQLVIYHRDTMTSSDVSAAVVREDLKSQRRRQAGVGS